MIDSVNRLAKRVEANGRLSYFRALSNIVDWGAEVASLSSGRIGILLISELNRTGGVVGMDLEYAASMVLYLKGDAVDKTVELKLISRGTPGLELGKYRRDYMNCALVPVSDQTKDADARDEPDRWPPGELELALEPEADSVEKMH